MRFNLPTRIYAEDILMYSRNLKINFTLSLSHSFFPSLTHSIELFLSFFHLSCGFQKIYFHNFFSLLFYFNNF